jgi:lipoprotein-releasing system permease protein
MALFESGLWEYDSNWALVPLAAAQSFFGLSKDQASALEMRVEDIYAVETQARTVQEAMGDEFATNTWIELNRPLFSALELEKLALFVAIGLIVLVAALNIVSTLTLMVMDKNRDISIITAMGGTPRTVTAVFMLQGLIIGLFGTGLGGILGAVTAWYLDAYQAIELEPRVYSIPYVPFQLNPWDLVVVSLLAIVISFAATLYPARAASRLDPVEGLRYE